MLGLSHYESSSEDEAAPSATFLVAGQRGSPPLSPFRQEKETSASSVALSPVSKHQDAQPQQHGAPVPVSSEEDIDVAEPARVLCADAVPIGPTFPPPQHSNTYHPDDATSPSASAFASAPPSPSTTTRATLHNLTLPPHSSNFSIPPSPPTTPPPSTTTKIQRFLALKASGVHYNAKLAASTALGNPGFFAKMMDFAGVDRDGNSAAQYACTLSEGLAPVPRAGFGEWAYVEEVNRSQMDGLKAWEEERRRNGREGVEFVSAGLTASAGTGMATGLAEAAGRGSENGTPMTGLSIGRGNTSAITSVRAGAVGSGEETEKRRPGSRFDERERARQRRRSGSRSAKRHRRDA